MKVLGFPIDDFDRVKLDSMTDDELYNLCLENRNEIILYQNAKQFFTHLNSDAINDLEYWYYIVN